MTLRVAKILLVFGVALYLSVVVFTNLTDYEPNFELVRHVLMMDSTFVDGHSMWRALNAPAWHVAFYATIVVWESTAAILCWWAGLRLAKALGKDASAFRKAKNLAIVGLTLNLLMWLVAFLTVGGEWFLMWQSKVWNGQQSAFRMFTVAGIILLLLVQPEPEERP
jgi:predicted small integral membrane protein